MNEEIKNIENEEVEIPVSKTEETVESFREEEAPVAPVARKRRSNASIDPAKFDWDAFENNVPASESKEDLEKKYSESLSKIAENEVIEGTVTGLTAKEVIVNVGYKSEGVIQRNEFRYNPDLKVGDKVDVLVENPEDKKGQLILSHKKACSLKSWDRVNEAFEKNEIVKGFIKARTKGGMIVDVFGIEERKTKEIVIWNSNQ